MNRALARNWWLVLLRGILGVVFAVVAFSQPGATMLSLVIVFSAYLMVDGVCAIASAIRAARQHERWGLLVFQGLLSIAAAAGAVMWPGISLIAFVLLIAAWAIISGVLMLGAAFRVKADHGRWWFAIGGVASLIYGGLLVASPLTGAIVLTWWLGAYALVFGIALIVMSFKLRSHRKDHPGAIASARA
jgi:uncharacterized membrane protein HdeD (DUF308 family)